MKRILTISLVLMSVIGYSQSKDNTKFDKSEIELVGIWVLTDYDQPNKFEDIWQFTSENIFNELKFKEDGDTTLIPDENGSWILNDSKLTITIAGEKTNSKQSLYKEPQIWEFEITRGNNSIILHVLDDSNKKVRLMLRKR